MIEIYKFMTLDIDERVNHVWRFGTYLISREESGYIIDLYYLNNYYVEMFYNNVDNSIAEIKTFRSAMFLNPYLDQIDIGNC